MTVSTITAERLRRFFRFSRRRPAQHPCHSGSTRPMSRPVRRFIRSQVKHATFGYDAGKPLVKRAPTAVPSRAEAPHFFQFVGVDGAVDLESKIALIGANGRCDERTIARFFFFSRTNHSNSGKTTLMNVLMGDLSPTDVRKERTVVLNKTHERIVVARRAGRSHHQPKAQVRSVSTALCRSSEKALDGCRPIDDALMMTAVRRSPRAQLNMDETPVTFLTRRTGGLAAIGSWRRCAF